MDCINYCIGKVKDVNGKNTYRIMNKLTTKQVTDYYKSGDANYLVASPAKEDSQKYITDQQRDELYKYALDISEKGCEITFSFTEEIHNTYSNATLTKMVHEFMLKMVGSESVNMVGVGEISDLGRFHVHCVFYGPPRVAQKVRREAPRCFGRTEIKALSYPKSYVDYMFKISGFNRAFRKIYKKEYFTI